MRISDNDAIVARAKEELERHWAEAAAQWRDSARADFEATHMEEIRTALKSARDAIHKAQALLQDVIKECS
jgi:vacuolar-type H+-ATPase subunit E/Vma4